MTPLKRQFFRYALPSMLSQLLNSCFIIVDGFFIGRNLGDIGLAAINVAWPITAFIQAVSLGLGLGGAVRLSTALGRGDKEEAALARGNTLTALAAAGVVMSVGLWLACPVILPLIGAKGELYAPALEYSRMICALALGQTINTGVLPLLRSSHKTMQAMSFTIVGLLGNIFMDWLFIQVFQWGLAGAAVATGSSQILCAVLALPTLLAVRELPLRRADFAPRWRMLRGIVQYGISPFGLSISTSVILLITNLQALHWGGTRGVAVYAVLSYVLGAVIPLVTGVGDGVQPLLSHARGAGEWGQLALLRRWGLSLAVGVALVCSVLTWLGRSQLPLVFGASPEATAEGAAAMWTLCIGYPFMAVVRFCSSYFCAVGEPVFSGILAYGEPLGTQPLMLLVLPLFLGLTGVWVAWPAAVALAAVAALVLLAMQAGKQPPGGKKRKSGRAAALTTRIYGPQWNGPNKEEPPWKRKRPWPAQPAARW